MKEEMPPVAGSFLGATDLTLNDESGESHFELCHCGLESWRCRCCCDHPDCCAFRQNFWCDRLFFVEETSSGPVDTGALEKVAGAFLPERKYEYLAVGRERADVFVYSILFCLGTGELTLSSRESVALGATLKAACGKAEDPNVGLAFKRGFWSCCGDEATDALETLAEKLSDRYVAGNIDLFFQLAQELENCGFPVAKQTQLLERFLIPPGETCY